MTPPIQCKHGFIVRLNKNDGRNGFAFFCGGGQLNNEYVEYFHFYHSQKCIQFIFILFRRLQITLKTSICGNNSCGASAHSLSFIMWFQYVLHISSVCRLILDDCMIIRNKSVFWSEFSTVVDWKWRFEVIFTMGSIDPFILKLCKSMKSNKKLPRIELNEFSVWLWRFYAMFLYPLFSTCFSSSQCAHQIFTPIRFCAWSKMSIENY